MLESLPISPHMFICQRYTGLCSPIICVVDHHLSMLSLFLPPPTSCGIFSAFSLLYCGIFALQYKVLELNIFELVLYSTEKPFKWWKHLQAPPLLKAVSCFISQLEQRLQTHNHNHGRLFSVMATLFLFTPVSSGDHETITICKLSQSELKNCIQQVTMKGKCCWF